MSYKEITVVLANAPAAHVHGEYLLDTNEGTLVAYNEEGGTVTFNWNHVAYFVVTDPEDDHDV